MSLFFNLLHGSVSMTQIKFVYQNIFFCHAFLVCHKPISYTLFLVVCICLLSFVFVSCTMNIGTMLSGCSVRIRMLFA